MMKLAKFLVSMQNILQIAYQHTSGAKQKQQ